MDKDRIMNLISASNPIWSNAGNTAIDILAQFDTFPSPIPFTASSTDSEQYGRDIYTRAASGEFGSVAAYVPPPPPPTDNQSPPDVIQ